MSTRAWDCHDHDLDELPPDLTGFKNEQCGEEWRSWGCTRLVGHTGRHAAGTGRSIVAVWPEGGETP